MVAGCHVFGTYPTVRVVTSSPRSLRLYGCEDGLRLRGARTSLCLSTQRETGTGFVRFL